MASRKGDREQRRAERLQAEADAAAAQRRKRSVQLASLAVLGAVILVVALIVVSQSGDDDDGDDATEIAGVAQVESLLRGLDQQGTTIGDPDAPVTVAEYGDMQCPACAEYAETVVADLIEGPVRAGEANLDFRHWVILTPLDGESGDAARAALAAAEQGRGWQFVELFYLNQGAENSGYVTDDFLEAIAEAAGVADLERWNEDRASDAYDAELTSIDAQAQDELGFTGTPSFAVEGADGIEPLGTPQSAAEIESAIRQAAN